MFLSIGKGLFSKNDTIVVFYMVLFLTKKFIVVR